MYICVSEGFAPATGPPMRRCRTDRVWKRAITSFHQYPCKEAWDPQGATPFLKAVGVGAVYMAKLLAPYSNVQAKNRLGKSARDLAKYKPMVKFVRESYNTIR